MAGAFGTVFMPEMSISWFDGNGWTTPQMVASDHIPIHPAAHVLHYSSTCFDGQKAFKHSDGSVYTFRIEDNIERFAQSSRLLHLPTIDQDVTKEMTMALLEKYADDVPDTPGSMYIRPTHIGTDVSIGKAAAPSSTSAVYILLSPVGDYFASGDKALKLLVDEHDMRCAPHVGMVKSGGNYASALHPIMSARAEHDVDQVLFSPDGIVQETGASNFIMIDGDELITPALNTSFLHGITRDSILTLARDAGYRVNECELSVSEVIERAQKPETEASLPGTAAVLAPVGELLYAGKTYTVGSGKPGPKTLALRKRLNDIQWGLAKDTHGWLTKVR